MTTNTDTATSIRWAGWWRPCKGLPWQRLAEAADYDACWWALLRAVVGRARGECLVVRAAKDPNEVQP